MDVYQHDSAGAFRLVIKGELSGEGVRDLEWAWKTAQSIIAGRELVVDLSSVTFADAQGVDLLCRMRASGARLDAALPPISIEFIRSMGISAAVPRRRLPWHRGRLKTQL